MNREVIQTIYAYHYARLREIWQSIDTLSEADFLKEVPYSTGSLRNHMVHLVDDDLSWFALLEGKKRPLPLRPEDFATRTAVRAEYDRAEAAILRFVDRVDETILQQTFMWDAPMTANPLRVSGWQILLHVVNHGTDHRAQLLRILHDFGAPSFDQDLMGYLVSEKQKALDE